MKLHKISISKLFFAILIMTLIVTNSYPITASNHANEDVRVFIEFRQPPGLAEKELLQKFNGRVHFTYELIPAINVTLPSSALKGLRNNKNIKGIYSDVIIHADSTDTYPWGITQIGANTAHTHTNGHTGGGINVAIIDTGIAPHEDLNIVGGASFLERNSDGSVIIDETPNSYYDDNGHGTHVAGTVAALINGVGVVGAAPNVNLFALKILDSNGSGYLSSSIAAIEWCYKHDIQITNNSYGVSSNPGYPALEDIFNHTFYGESSPAGLDTDFDNDGDNDLMVHIASAGNNGNPPGRGDNVGWPANYSGTIAIAATDKSDKRASFSSTGANVELSAPGVDIYSTVRDPNKAISSLYEDGWNGTSMASPHVAGVAALVLSQHPTWTPEQIRTRLTSTAIDLGSSGRDEKYGYGLVNAVAALGLDSEPNEPPANNVPLITITSPTDGNIIQEGTSIFFSATVDDEPISPDDVPATTDNLVWTSTSNEITETIGTGTDFNAALPVGVHTITASASDGTNEGTDTVQITVEPLDDSGDGTSLSVISVTEITYETSGGRHSDAHLEIYILVQDDQNALIEGASVSAKVTGPSESETYNGTTGSDGQVMFKWPGAPSGTYTTTITSLTASGFEWDLTTPDDNSFVK